MGREWRHGFTGHSLGFVGVVLCLGACGDGSESSSAPVGTESSEPANAGPDPERTVEPGGGGSPGTSLGAGGEQPGAGGAPASAVGGAGAPGSECLAENQPQTRDGNGMCYSPFYNAGLHQNPDVLGCDCELCDHATQCVDGTQYLCAYTWFHKEAGSCAAPNACTELWLKTFQSDTIEDCERLAGGFIIGDDPDAPVSCRIELTFTDYLDENRQAAGSRTGEWRCDGLRVTGIFGPTEIQGTYDPETDVLVWDGLQMQHTDTIELE